MLRREVLSRHGDHVWWIVNGIGDPNGAQDCTTYTIRVVRLGTSNYQPHVELPSARAIPQLITRPTSGDIGSCMATTAGVGTHVWSGRASQEGRSKQNLRSCTTEMRAQPI